MHLQSTELSGGRIVFGDPAASDACGVRFGFISRLGGVSSSPYASLNLSDATGDDLSCVRRNRMLALEAIGAGDDAASLIVPKQVHGDDIVVVGGSGGEDVARARNRAESGADAVVCTHAGVPVMLCFADCVPVILVAPSGGFAVVHSGWRGALAGIAGKALGVLARESGSAASECFAFIGAHIRSCCFEVSVDVAERFVSRWGSACLAAGEEDSLDGDGGVEGSGSRTGDEGREGGVHLALEAVVRASLAEAGADPSRIASCGVCTSCNTDTWFSHRAEHGLTGRHGALAYIPR